MSKAETYIGKPCPHGHNGTRYRSNMACVECAKAMQARLYDRKAATARKRAYRATQRAANQQKGE